MRQVGRLCSAGGRLFAVAIVTLVSISAANADDVLDRIMRDKTVRIGFSATPSVIARDPKTGKLSGYFVDAANFIFNEIGVKPEYSELSFANLVAAIQSGSVDISIVNSFITVKRAAAVNYTRPLLFVSEAMIVRKNETRFKSLQDLNRPGVRIACLQGGAGPDFLRRNLPKAQIVALDTTNKAAPFIQVAAGQADAGIQDASAAQAYMKQDPSVKLLTDRPFDIHPSAWIVKKGEPDFLNFINSSLTYLIDSGKFRDMAARYPSSGQFMPKLDLEPFP